MTRKISRASAAVLDKNMRNIKDRQAEGAKYRYRELNQEL